MLVEGHWPMTEKREAPRKRVLKGAKAILPGGGVIDCTIRNLSDTGAQLQVEPLAVPNTFELRIPGREGRLMVQVVWRKSGAIGVRFLP